MAYSKPLVSVIVNCRNGGSYLRNCIDSILDQTYKNIEVIFYDNNSKDNSKEIIFNYDSDLINYFYSHRNLSLGEARNMALKEATGEYVAFLDTDDVYLKDKISTQVEAMTKKDFEVSYSGYYEINSKGKILKKIKPRISSGYIFAKLLRRYDANIQTIMFKRELKDTFNLEFDKNLDFSCDGDFFLRLSLHKKILVLNNPLVKYRIHPGQYTKKNYSNVAKEFEITLKKLADEYSEKIKNHKDDFAFALKKLTYYEFLDELLKNNFNEALKKINIIKFYNYKYLLIWIFVNIFRNKKIILKILNRNEK